jgi:hypothetical protein
MERPIFGAIDIAAHRNAISVVGAIQQSILLFCMAAAKFLAITPERIDE